VATSFSVFRPQLETIVNGFSEVLLAAERPAVRTDACPARTASAPVHHHDRHPTSCRFAAYAEFLNMPNDSGPMTSTQTFVW
jgi:hypothetical protein